MIKALIQDRPFVVTLIAAVLVGLHCLLTGINVIPNVWLEILSDRTNLVTLSVGLASGGAILAGFAGVIVIHGLSASSPRFRVYRLTAGKHLHANWASISSAGFISSGISMASALFAMTQFVWWSPWMLELAALLALHGVLRLLWLLRTFFNLQADDDADQFAKESETPLSNLFDE